MYYNTIRNSLVYSLDKYIREAPMGEAIYKRIMLKLSGEVLAGGKGHGFDFDTTTPEAMRHINIPFIYGK